jgi:hypothetical protein
MPNLTPPSAVLKNLAHARRNPEFAEAMQELTHAANYGQKMRSAGKLSKVEHEEFERLLLTKYIEALPVDDFQEMMKDGRLEQLQALAGHEDDRDSGDVQDSRNAIYRKVQADALDEAWLDQRITAEHYAREARDLSPSEEIDLKISNGDHASAAAEMFAARHDVSTHDADLSAYLDKTYGSDRYGDKVSSEPPQKVVRDRSDDYDAEKTLQENLASRIGEPAPQREVVDANGITDVDARDAQEAGQ